LKTRVLMRHHLSAVVLILNHVHHGNFAGNITIYLNDGTDAAPIFNSSSLLQEGGINFDVGTKKLREYMI